MEISQTMPCFTHILTYSPRCSFCLWLLLPFSVNKENQMIPFPWQQCFLPWKSVIVFHLSLYVFRLTHGWPSLSLKVVPSIPLPSVDLKAGPSTGCPVWAATVRATGLLHPGLQPFPCPPPGTQLPSFVMVWCCFVLSLWSSVPPEVPWLVVPPCVISP